MSWEEEDPDETGRTKVVFDPDHRVVRIEGEETPPHVVDALIDAWLIAVQRIIAARRSGARPERPLPIAEMEPGQWVASHRVKGKTRQILRDQPVWAEGEGQDEADEGSADFAFTRFCLDRNQIES